MNMFAILAVASVTLATHLTFAAPLPPPTVFTEKAAQSPIFTLLTFPARVTSTVNAVVRCEADGIVSKIVRGLGTKVRRGETIAIIRHTDPVYEFVPLNVLATVDGVVSEVAVTPGSLVNKGDPIVTVTDPKRMRVVIEVAALDLAAIHAGVKGELSIPGMFLPINVEVTGVSPSIDPMIGTATCELGVEKSSLGKVYAGMSGRVQFKVNQHTGFLLPDFAIAYKGSDAFVRLVKDGKALKIPVKLGDRRQGQVEILSGLKAGDEVINRASRFVAEGETVKVESAHE